jgi:hypothetical protein
MLVDPLSSGSRRLKGGGSQDWLPHFFDPVIPIWPYPPLSRPAPIRVGY